MEMGASTRAALDADGSAVLADDAVRHREAQASSFADPFGCEKWIVDSLQMLGRNALSAICYFDASKAVFVPSSDRQGATGLHGVPGVQEKIQEDLLQLARVRFYHW